MQCESGGWSLALTVWQYGYNTAQGSQEQQRPASGIGNAGQADGTDRHLNSGEERPASLQAADVCGVSEEGNIYIMASYGL